MGTHTHTSGSWEVKAYSDCLRVIHYRGMGSNQVVCTVEPAVTPAQREANARLIAAAPELLELAHQYASDLRYPPTADSRDRRLERIAAVLEKAGATC